jgi:hypothetical protein
MEAIIAFDSRALRRALRNLFIGIAALSNQRQFNHRTDVSWRPHAFGLPNNCNELRSVARNYAPEKTPDRIGFFISGGLRVV